MMMNNNMECFNCFSNTLIQLSSDVTCTTCGCEQNLGNMIPEINSYERVSYIDNDILDNKNNSHILLELNAEAFEETANKYFNNFIKDTPTKTYRRRAGLYIACLSIAGANLNFSEAVMKIDTDIKTITYFLNKLTEKSNTKNVRDNKNFNFELSRILTLCPKEKFILFRKESYRLYDILLNSPLFYKVQSCKQNGFAGAIFYNAFKNVKINTKLKDISFVLDTTNSTVLNIVKKIDKIMESSKTDTHQTNA